MKLVEFKKLTNAQVGKLLGDESTSKSSKIKALFEAGFSVKQVSDMVGVRYNFAYNVISNHVNMNGLVVESTRGASKKDAVVELHVAGKSLKEISVELKTNYNYVHKIVKEYKASQVASEQAAE